MRVLIACEFSGIVRDAFLEREHDAMSCDLLPTESPGPHYEGDVFDVLDNGWDLMIAHPPCTYLSKAGARWLYPKAGEISESRYQQGLLGRQFFLKILLSAFIPHIAVENPTPLKVFKLPTPTQIVQPYEYGHPYSKRTLLWLKGLPKLRPTQILDSFRPYLHSNTGGKKRGQSYSRGIVHTSHDASRFWTGIAKAMADQWGELSL